MQTMSDELILIATEKLLDEAIVLKKEIDEMDAAKELKVIQFDLIKGKIEREMLSRNMKNIESERGKALMVNQNRPKIDYKKLLEDKAPSALSHIPEYTKTTSTSFIKISYKDN